MPGYRVFITYSRDETERFAAVHDALQRVGLDPWSDKDLAVGPVGFTEQIQKYISHSHLFVPIITPLSHSRGWVHQEIGFAVAMNIPVIPICVGALPDGMIQMSHAIVVDDVGAECLARLQACDFRGLVSQAGKKWLPSGECAQEPGERAVMIERYADEAWHALRGAQCVRHAGGLSSFRLPDEDPSRPVWRAHYGANPRGPEAYRKYRAERRALSRHAEAAGCKLIVNYGVDLDAAYGQTGVWHSRIRSLVEYLKSLPDDKVEIALVTDVPAQALLIVGSWFLAESAAVRPVRGIQQTLFMSHAPSIDARVEEFDRDLRTLLADQEKQGCQPGRSRSWAVDVLSEKMSTLPRHPAWP